MAWAGLTVLRPAEDPLQATGHTFVVIAPGEIGESIALNTLARWEPVPVGSNRAEGVVTRVAVATGDEVSAGAVLYEVDLRPVVVARGLVPAFRSIGSKAQGPDVAQLQKMLKTSGFYRGKADGDAGPDTVRAIRKWQHSLGLKPTGTVEIGDVIFVPDLPTRISLDTEVVRRGATLRGGEEVVRGLSAAPVFSIPVTEAQAGMVPAGTRVEMSSPAGETWKALVSGRTREAESSTVVLTLEGEDGRAVCGEQCAQIPASDEVSLSSVIVTVESVLGLVVPSAALVAGADGQIAVIDESGQRILLDVVASARGMSVVTGVAEGTRVRVPGDSNEGG